MARLFNRDEKTLQKHINNVFSEEVEKDNNTHFLRVDGVKVLKEYMLKGYAINQRKIATDLQIVDRLHEQRQLIEGQGVEIAELRNTTEKRLGEQDSRCTNSNRGHSCDRNAI